MDKIPLKIKKVYLASDHAGYELKQKLKDYLISKYELELADLGAHELVEYDNYTIFMHEAGQCLQRDIDSDGLESVAFVFGGSGEGEAMVMNKYQGVRCTTYYGYNLDIVALGREHNDANALSFGARFLQEDEIKKAADVFLTTAFSFGRHEGRVRSIALGLGL